MKIKQQSFDDFKKDVIKDAGGKITSPVRQTESGLDGDEFSWEEYFEGKHRDKYEGETEDYIQEEWKEPVYDGELKYVNLGVQKLKKLLLTETNEEEIRLMNVAIAYCYKLNPPSGFEMGEPYRGEKRIVKRVKSLKELL